MTIPKNIQLFECKDDGSFGPMVAQYFAQGKGSIYATIIKNTWYLFNAAEDAEEYWHKPGPMACTFCDSALRDQKMIRISEEHFEERTGVWYLETTRGLMGAPNPWNAQ